MYGFTEGDSENIHELITSNNIIKMKYYSDILIVKMTNKKIITDINCQNTRLFLQNILLIMRIFSITMIIWIMKNRRTTVIIQK